MYIKEAFDKIDKIYLPISLFLFCLVLIQALGLIETRFSNTELGSVFIIFWGQRIIYRVLLGYRIKIGMAVAPGLTSESNNFERTTVCFVGLIFIVTGIWNLSNTYPIVE
jgi:hypothetical protein